MFKYIQILFLLAFTLLNSLIVLAQDNDDADGDAILVVRDGVITIDRWGNVRINREIDTEAEEEIVEDESYFQLSLSAGIANASQANSQLVVTRSETDILEQTNDNDWNGWTAQLGVGYYFPLEWEDDYFDNGDDSQWFDAIIPQLNLYILNSAALTGAVKRFDDPDDVDATYAMNFDSTRLMFDLGANIFTIRKFSFFALAGLGIAWTSTDFQMEHDDYVLIHNLDLGTTNDSGFAYEFGAGVNYLWDEETNLTLQYLYTGFDNVSVSGQDENFNVHSSDLDIKAQSLLLGFQIKI